MLLSTNNTMSVRNMRLKLIQGKNGDGNPYHVLVVEADVGDRLEIISNYFLEDQAVDQARMLVNTWEANKTGTDFGVAVPEPVLVA